MKKILIILSLVLANIALVGGGDSTEVRSFRADAMQFKLDSNRLVINMPKVELPKDGVVMAIRDYQIPGTYYKYVYKINLKKKKDDTINTGSNSPSRNK